MADPNLELLARVAAALGELRERLTLVGGCATALLITDPGILGFSNRWYGAVLKNAFVADLGQGIAIRVADAPSFVATKLEAFLDRGRGDYLSSHDLEDVLSVVDGRAGLAAELEKAGPDLRSFVAETFARLLADEGFRNALPGLIVEGSPAVRTAIVLERLQAIAGLRA